MGSKDNFVLQNEQDTKVKLGEIEKSVQDNKEEVIQRILSLVYEIKPELHENVRFVPVCLQRHTPYVRQSPKEMCTRWHLYR